MFICMIVFVSSHGLKAQQLESPLPDSARLATITTDTGAFVMGHRDFSRYTVPGMCLAAAENTRAGFRGGEVFEAHGLAHYLSDSTQIKFSGELDTTGAGGTAVVARACGAQFTVAGTKARDLHDLFLVALHAQNDSIAQTILERLVVQAPTEQARQTIWKTGFDTMLGLGHRMAAEALMSRFDTGSSSSSARALHLALLDGLRMQDSIDDSGHLRQETDREIEEAKAIPANAQAYFSMDHAYRTLMDMAVEKYPADSIVEIAQRAQRDLSVFPNDIARRPWRNLPVDSVVTELAPAWYTRMMRITHAHYRAPRLQANFWFPAPGTARGDTLRPVPGKVNVICFGDMQTPFLADVVERGGPLGQAALNAHDVRWLRKYQAVGVVFTMVERTYGYGWTSGVTDRDRYNFLTPANEVQQSDWMWHTYRRWPVTLAVQTSQSDWRPSPDGRRVSLSAIQFEDFANWYSDDYSHGEKKIVTKGACAVIGHNGEFIYEQGAFTGFQDMRHLEAVLDWVVRGQATSSVAHGSLQ